jgi:hypothetical protein
MFTSKFEKMKNYRLPLLLLLLVAHQALSAQTKMRWDKHGVGFTVPSNFKVETNNAEEYTASNDNLYLSIAPIQDENLTKEHLADAVIAMAKEMKYDVVKDADKIDIDDFTGYYVEGRKSGANAVMMALMDTKSSTNLLVVIVYADGFEKAAVNIAKSFFAYD